MQRRKPYCISSPDLVNLASEIVSERYTSTLQSFHFRLNFRERLDNFHSKQR